MSVCQVAYLCCCFGGYLRVANFREDPFHAIGCITLFCRDAQFLVYAPVQTDQERRRRSSGHRGILSGSYVQIHMFTRGVYIRSPLIAPVLIG